MMPAMNKDLIDVFVVTPYKTIGVEGGMIIPNVALEAVTAAAKVFGYTHPTPKPECFGVI